MITARANVLAKQAEKINSRSDIDVMELFRTNEEVHDKIVSGEWDFYDVAEAFGKKAKPRGPAPMRTSNGAVGATPNAIQNMTDEQFEKLEKRIQEGARYSLK